MGWKGSGKSDVVEEGEASGLATMTLADRSVREDALLHVNLSAESAKYLLQVSFCINWAPLLCLAKP
jgi:hypothetical protein